MPKQDNKFLTSYSGEGYRWKKNVRKKLKKGSQTAGRSKPNKINCRPSSLDKYMAKRGRSHKHPDFPSYSAKVREANNPKTSGI